VPDDRYSDDDPDRGRRYSDEPDRGRRPDDDYEDRRRYEDVDFRRGEEIPNYLVQSILVTLLCCWPAGLVAIINAAKVSSLVSAGNYEEARRASDTARTWCIISFVGGLVAVPLIIALQLAAK
jgi:hypothetical protein